MPRLCPERVPWLQRLKLINTLEVKLSFVKLLFLALSLTGRVTYTPDRAGGVSGNAAAGPRAGSAA